MSCIGDVFSKDWWGKHNNLIRRDFNSIRKLVVLEIKRCFLLNLWAYGINVGNWFHVQGLEFIDNQENVASKPKCCCGLKYLTIHGLDYKKMCLALEDVTLF